MARRRLVEIGFLCVLSTAAWADSLTPPIIATLPQPKWRDLTIKQKIVLAPLSDDWDSFQHYRRKNWLIIAQRFATMSPGEQRRVQTQMQEWGKLSAEKRQLARENFKVTSQLPSEKKQELKKKWEEYSNLPEAEKQKLQQLAESRKPGPPTIAPPLTPPPPAPAPGTEIPSASPDATGNPAAEEPAGQNNDR